jgi:hypothetical protein
MSPMGSIPSLQEPISSHYHDPDDGDHDYNHGNFTSNISHNNIKK